ncbi:tetratricopeptide repeat protein [Streptomyces sp. 6N223]|uniref:tetratricopeptide repeat protein n=1 Tax=Streptomyces sp. 6N223 TaxID=3457412 RepID=UPI003FD51649
MRYCLRPDCPGQGGGIIDRWDFCDHCHRRPLPEGPEGRARGAPEPAPGPPAVPPAPEREVPPSRPPRTPHPPSPPTAAEGSWDDELTLPEISAPQLTELIVKDPRPPTGGRPCRVCKKTVGIGFGGRPARPKGFCPYCSTPFSFELKLRPGDRIGGQYEVVGCRALGGQGWIYLAGDLELGRDVVLKSVIDPQDSTQLKMARAERRFLTELDHHPDIVGIYNSVRWGGTEYIVMEYVAGRTLGDLLDPARQREWLGGPLQLEHVVVYGCRILDALSYLHGRKLLYCDMSPDNVMHAGRQLKIIDLGGMRGIRDDDSPGVRKPHYLPDEELRRHPGLGFCVLTDLFTVARTLAELANSAEPAPQPAQESFGAVIARATSDHLAARFTTAAGMARQLRGVLREIRALAKGRQHTGQSLLFSPLTALLDGGWRGAGRGGRPGGGLGALQPARYRLLRPGPEGPELDLRPPAPEWVARRLPFPVPHPDDEAAATELRTCHDLLVHGGFDDARASLREACHRLGEDDARHDWRVAWACGVLSLTGTGDAPAEPVGDPTEDPAALRELLTAGPVLSHARPWFEAVRRALPGEPAAKLALAYCVERDYHHGTDQAARSADLERARRLYEAVWRRDNADGSAAFGLARLRLAEGRRDDALTVLDGVSRHRSPHHRAARIAAARVQAAWLPGHPPDAGHFELLRRRIDRDRDAAPRDGWPPEGDELLLLAAEIRESALCWAEREGHVWPPESLGRGELFGDPPTEKRLRELQEDALRQLAVRAGSAEEHNDLIDRAYEIRPESPR